MVAVGIGPAAAVEEGVEDRLVVVLEEDERIFAARQAAHLVDFVRRHVSPVRGLPPIRRTPQPDEPVAEDDGRQVGVAGERRGQQRGLAPRRPSGVVAYAMYDDSVDASVQCWSFGHLPGSGWSRASCRWRRRGRACRCCDRAQCVAFGHVDVKNITTSPVGARATVGSCAKTGHTSSCATKGWVRSSVEAWRMAELVSHTRMPQHALHLGRPHVPPLRRRVPEHAPAPGAHSLRMLRRAAGAAGRRARAELRARSCPSTRRRSRTRRRPRTVPLCEQSAADVHGVRVRVGSDWPETTASSPCGDHAPSVMPRMNSLPPVGIVEAGGVVGVRRAAAVARGGRRAERSGARFGARGRRGRRRRGRRRCRCRWSLAARVRRRCWRSRGRRSWGARLLVDVERNCGRGREQKPSRRRDGDKSAHAEVPTRASEPQRRATRRDGDNHKVGRLRAPAAASRLGVSRGASLGLARSSGPRRRVGARGVGRGIAKQARGRREPAAAAARRRRRLAAAPPPAPRCCASSCSARESLVCRAAAARREADEVAKAASARRRRCRRRRRRSRAISRGASFNSLCASARPRRSEPFRSRSSSAIASAPATSAWPPKASAAAAAAAPPARRARARRRAPSGAAPPPPRRVGSSPRSAAAARPRDPAPWPRPPPPPPRGRARRAARLGGGGALARGVERLLRAPISRRAAAAAAARAPPARSRGAGAPPRVALGAAERRAERRHLVVGLARDEALAQIDELRLQLGDALAVDVARAARARPPRGRAPRTPPPPRAAPPPPAAAARRRRALGLGRLERPAQLVALRRERVVRPAHAFARVAQLQQLLLEVGARRRAALELALERGAALLELRRARVGGLRVARRAPRRGVRTRWPPRGRRQIRRRRRHS